MKKEFRSFVSNMENAGQPVYIKWKIGTNSNLNSEIMPHFIEKDRTVAFFDLLRDIMQEIIPD